MAHLIERFRINYVIIGKGQHKYKVRLVIRKTTKAQREDIVLNQSWHNV